MKFVVDANLSPTVAEGLSGNGFPAIHVVDVDLVAASDETIFEWAVANALAIITADTDFAMMIALRHAAGPSIVQLRHVNHLTPTEHLSLLIANLPTIQEDLANGAIVSLSQTRLAIRPLPID